MDMCPSYCQYTFPEDIKQAMMAGTKENLQMILFKFENPLTDCGVKI